MLPAIADEPAPVSALVRHYNEAEARIRTSRSHQWQPISATQAVEQRGQRTLLPAEIKEIQEAIAAGPRLLLERRVEETYRFLRLAEKDAVTSAQELADSPWWDRFNGLRSVRERRLVLDQARIYRLDKDVESNARHLQLLTVAQKHLSRGEAAQGSQVLLQLDAASHGVLKLEPVLKRLAELQLSPSR